ncbi:MAG TPA: VWA domain-containing protein [Miltoncostaeaceae bacterium]|nr:VWA domain-containing protein [Miltoncostaeaceae bacterium]
MSFAAPLVLLAIPLLGAAVAAVALWRRRHPPVGVAHPDLDLIEAAAPGGGLLRRLPVLFALLAALALIVAVARPQIWRSEARSQATIMLAIDVSGSMSADDIAPYRLRAAQDAALRFAEDVPRQYRVGLVSFSSTANVLVAPTTDRLALSRAIEGLSPDGATAVGDAVVASLDAIRSLHGSEADTFPDARILLLSDGASTTGLPTGMAAERAVDAEVPVFTVSLGTPGGRLYDGTPVPPDPQELAMLAERTGGRAYQSRDAAAVREVYAHLGSFIGTERVRGEATGWVAGLAVVALLLAGVSAWFVWPRVR